MGTCRTHKCRMFSNGRLKVYKYRDKDFSVPTGNRTFRLSARQPLYCRSSNRSKSKRTILYIVIISISNSRALYIYFFVVYSFILERHDCPRFGGNAQKRIWSVQRTHRFAIDVITISP